MIQTVEEAQGRLSVPGPGRTLSSVSEPIATRLRVAASIVSRAFDGNAIETYRDLFAPRDQALAGSEATANQAAWALLGTWAVARILRPHEDNPNLDEAERLFFGSRVGLSRHLSEKLRRTAEEHLQAIDPKALVDLLPYALDQHGPGTRRSVLRDPSQRGARSAKRRQGIFSTPADVAEFMTNWVLANETDTDLPLLDPACGTGVFVLAAARQLRETQTPVETLTRLYGLDLDPIAIDGACFVLTAALAPDAPQLEPWRLWHLARLNLAQRDTLRLVLSAEGFGRAVESTAVAERRERLREQLLRQGSIPASEILPRGEWTETLTMLFPERQGAWAVVGNPPYAQLGPRPDLSQLPDHFASLRGSKVTASTNSFIPFVELMWALSRSRGRSCLVVPMSIAYNTTKPFRSLRRAMKTSGGAWTFRFFDRTPDALFGDDVKQRVAIVSREPQSEHVRVLTSSFLRWTSRQRGRLFGSLPAPVELPSAEISGVVPKIGSTWELNLYRTLLGRFERLGRVLVEAGHESEREMVDLVAVGCTAYNWFALYRDGSHRAEGTTATVFAAPDSARADWAYALLSTSLVYWLWRVEGDGFHVPASWVLGLPFEWQGSETDIRLAELGRDLWIDALRHPRVAVNRGRKTRSYRSSSTRHNQEVDRWLLHGLGLDQGLSEPLAAIRAEAIAVGRAGKDG